MNDSDGPRHDIPTVGPPSYDVRDRESRPDVFEWIIGAYPARYEQVAKTREN